jgi:hypothetical protein
VGATNRAGLAFNGRRFGGSYKRANTHSASGLDGCCGSHKGVHRLNYSGEDFKNAVFMQQKSGSEPNFDVMLLSVERKIVLNWDPTPISSPSLVEASLDRQPSKFPFSMKGWREATG